jgi:hypothetical protein
MKEVGNFIKAIEAQRFPKDVGKTGETGEGKGGRKGVGREGERGWEPKPLEKQLEAKVSHQCLSFCTPPAHHSS